MSNPVEQHPPDIRQYNDDNIREKRWTHFSLEGVKLPAATVDVIQRGEALAIFRERPHFPFPADIKGCSLVHTSTAGWGEATHSTEEVWRTHAEGVLMVALTNLNLPPEAWRSARLLRAGPNCRLVLTLAYRLLSPALSIEEAGLMTNPT